MIGIIGYGPVGRKTAKLFNTEEIADKSLNMKLSRKPEIAIICVPEEDLDEAIKEYEGCHIIIRSTISPKNANKYKDYTLFPEFDVTETQNKGSDLAVMTEDLWLYNQLVHMLPSSTKIHIVSHIEACLIKLFDVNMLTRIVETINTYETICSKYNIHWTNIRNVLLNDERFPKSHSQYIGDELTKCCKLSKFNLNKELI